MTKVGQGKKLATKKATRRKKAVTLKNQPMFALVDKNQLKELESKGCILLNNPRPHENHSINSFCLDNGEEQVNDMVIVKMEIVGKPIVKTTRNITIKK